MPAKKIGLLVLVLFIIGSIDSLRNMPAAALFGPQLIFFFVAAAITFLMPIALISAELSSAENHQHHNGVYQWVREAFGTKTGWLAIWLQWINTTVWFPTILSFIAGGIAYLINPNLLHYKMYMVAVILIVFWVMTLLSLRNFSVSAGFASLCAVIGFVLPLCVIIVLFIVWLVGHHHSYIHISWHNVWPRFSHLNDWVSLVAVVTSFLGMELAAVNIKDIKNPQRTYPKGVMIAGFVILVTMVIGSLAIATVIPNNKIGLVDGIFQMFNVFLSNFHLTWLVWILGAMVILGTIGEMINWIISPARGLQQAALSGVAPKWFAHNNKHGLPARILVLQAIVVTGVCLAFLLLKSVGAVYWLLTDLSTEMYLFMYILMFAAALRLHYQQKNVAKKFTIIGGAPVKWLLCLMGLFSSVLTVFIGFVPPKQMHVALWHYDLIFGIGIILMLLPALLLMGYQKWHDKSS